jgi:RNA recognition motif-containing protein
MKVIYSKITELNVKHNDERSRDYRSSLRSEEGRGSGILGNHPLSRTQSDYYDEPRYRSERSERSERSDRDYNEPRDTRGRDRDGMKGEPTPVVLVSNLDDRKTTPDHIFTLFGVYGDVEKVKVLPTKRDTALVQFANIQGAETCLQFLRKGVPLFGGQLHIQRSKHFNINSPTNNDPDSELFRSYYNSSYHRFRHAGSKNLEHICEPSRTLHVSNVNAQLTEDEVQRVFERYGNVEMVRFFGSKRSSSHNRADGTEKKMATVRMDTLEAGVRALVELHEREISRMPIKITFSEKRSDMIPDPKPSDRRQREEREAPRDDRREDRNAPRDSKRDSRDERRDDRREAPREAIRDEREPPRDDRRDAPREIKREERRDNQRDERRDAPRDNRRDERDAPRDRDTDPRRDDRRDAPFDKRDRDDRKRDDQDPRKAPRETKRDSREGRERDRNERREVAPRRHH